MNLYNAGLGLISLNILGDKYVSGICKQGEKHEHCRYFAEDDCGPVCLKLTEYKHQIDEEVSAYLNLAYHPCELPVGDNCTGCEPPLSLLLN